MLNSNRSFSCRVVRFLSPERSRQKSVARLLKNLLGRTGQAEQRQEQSADGEFESRHRLRRQIKNNQRDHGY